MFLNIKKNFYYAKYYKKNNIKYIEINDEISLYNEKQIKIVFFPKDIEYVRFSKQKDIGGYNILWIGY